MTLLCLGSAESQSLMIRLHYEEMKKKFQERLFAK